MCLPAFPWPGPGMQNVSALVYHVAFIGPSLCRSLEMAMWTASWIVPSFREKTIRSGLGLRSFLVAHWVKDQVLSLLWLLSLLCYGFDPWPSNSMCPMFSQKKERKKKKRQEL